MSWNKRAGKAAENTNLFIRLTKASSKRLMRRKKKPRMRVRNIGMVALRQKIRFCMRSYLSLFIFLVVPSVSIAYRVIDGKIEFMDNRCYISPDGDSRETKEAVTTIIFSITGATALRWGNFIIDARYPDCTVQWSRRMRSIRPWIYLPAFFGPMSSDYCNP